MKLTALQQQSRRINTFRGSSPLDSSADGGIKSPASGFWLTVHGFCCLISLVLGFRFSRIVLYLLFSTSTTSTTPFSTIVETLAIQTTLSTSPENSTATSSSSSSTTSSRVVVGRHGILIRPWPHPNPAEVMRAHKIIERVQREQKLHYGVKKPRMIIAITPTYVRTFQALHLNGVMQTLMNVQYDIIWIVVEAGDATSETASLLDKSGLRTIHIGFDQKMPITLEDRHKLEAKLRLRGLRVVREQKLDGIVMFADDSNMHSMELFDEIQNVKWIGAVSVGTLAHSGGVEEDVSSVVPKEEEMNSRQLPIQGPVCNSTNHLMGWHTFNSQPFMERSARYIGDRAMVLPRKVEWSGFVLNSRLVWKDAEDKPKWVKDLDFVFEDGEDIKNPLSLLKNASVVEPLGSCGRKIMLWWLRVEARADSKFPARWIIDPPLDITVPAKRTPWPDAPPELPSTTNVINILENTENRSTKTRPSRRRGRSKRKHVVRVADDHVTEKHSGDN